MTQQTTTVGQTVHFYTRSVPGAGARTYVSGPFDARVDAVDGERVNLSVTFPHITSEVHRVLHKRRAEQFGSAEWWEFMPAENN